MALKGLGEESRKGRGEGLERGEKDDRGRGWREGRRMVGKVRKARERGEG